MLNIIASAVIVLASLYLLWLAALALAAPARARGFLRDFASSARAHYLELSLRLIIGASFLLQAPQMRYPELFNFAGWLLIITTLPLLAMPWRWHRRIAERAVPFATSYLWLFGMASAVLGAFVLVSLAPGIRP